MENWYMIWLAAAAQQPWALSDISKYWDQRGGDTLSMVWFFIAAAGLVASVGTVWLARWYHRHHARPSPLWIFHGVAQAIGLNLADQWLLIRVAKQQQLPSALTLLLSPDTLAFHGADHIRSIAPPRREAMRRRLAKVAHSLFSRTADSHDYRGRSAPLS